MKELINKFPNGQDLYNNNATFNTLINHIYRGMSLYEAISVFAEQNIKQQEIMENLVRIMPMQPIMFSIEDSTENKKFIKCISCEFTACENHQKCIIDIVK